MEIKGIKYVGPVFDNCYDDQTEVLTSEGWKLFSHITYNDNICTLNSDHVLEYHKPLNIINKEYSGDMYHFKSKYNGIDLLVTPNHNMYVQTDRGYRDGKIHDLYTETYNVPRLAPDSWRFETAEYISNKTRYFKKDCNNLTPDREHIKVCGRLLKTEYWLEFLGYYLSEGSATITKRNNYIIQIRQFGKDIYKMADVLSKITPNKVNIRYDDGRVLVNDKELCLYLKKTFGDKYNKYIPQDILLTCSRKQLLILFNALMLGDGHDSHENYKKGLISGGSSYNTSSVRLRDSFMELLLKIGYSGTYKKIYSSGDTIKVLDRDCVAKADNWTITVRFCNNVCCFSEKHKSSVSKVLYSGRIYCVTVPNHTLFVRRNGCVVWSGNSGYAKACRGNILALHSLGIPVTISPISFEDIKPDLGKDGEILDELNGKFIDYNIVLIHTTPEFWSKYREDGVTNIGYTIWETTKLHPEWKNYINSNVDKVLVGCEWNKKVFEDSGVNIPIGVVPHGISLDAFDVVEPYKVNGLKKDSYVFYSIFQWCYDEKTRVLTKEGFKYFKDLSYRDYIATLNKETDELEYHKPDKIVNFKRNDKMLHLKGAQFDLCVTPDHKMVVKGYAKGSYKASPEDSWKLKPLNEMVITNKNGDLKVSRKYRTKKNCIWKGERQDFFEVPGESNVKMNMDLFLEFLGWYLSEGSIEISKNYYRVTITQRKSKDNKKEIWDNIRAMGFTPINHNDKDILFNCKDLCLYLKQFGKCNEKYIPESIKNLSSDQIMILLTSLFKCDGSYHKNGTWCKYITTSKKLAEDVQECLLKIGFSGSVSISGPKTKKSGIIEGREIKGKLLQYTVSVNIENNEPSMYYADLDEIDYDGYVYCATVPNHTMLVERNGKVLFCGNTERKHPVALLKAYWYAFQQGENVALVLKTYRSNYSESEKNAIRTTIQRLKSVTPADNYPPVYFISEMLSEEEISGLHARGNCYVSLDRGEGFGLSPFTAGAAGNPIIVTGFGGSTEYAKEDNSYLINYTLTPVSGMPWSPWYRMNQLWAEPDIKHAADLMRHVFNNKSEAKSRGLLLKEYIRNGFSWRRIGNKLIEEINKL